MSDITEIKRILHDRAQDVAAYLLPNGIRSGREWCVGSIQGERGESLKVCVQGAKSGTWSDFACGGDGGDLIDLWCSVKSLPLPQAIDDARAWLGMPKPNFEKKDRSFRRPENPRCSTPKSAVFEYLTKKRLISIEALTAYMVGEDGRTMVFPSYLPGKTLVGVKFIKIDRLNGKKESWVSPDCEPILFGWQSVANKNTRECTITEGEIDALTAFDYGLPLPLSVPFGGGTGAKQAWIEREFERLAQFEIIYLALDCDKPGDAACEEIANRIGRHRCLRVRLPRKDLNQCRVDGITKEEIQQCFKTAATLDPEELSRAGAFTDDVIGLFWPKDGEEPGYSLPWGKLSNKIRFRPGELTIWSGATGVGKSQVLSHALVAMGEQGARVCVASLEMAPGQLLRRAVKQAGNIDRPTEGFIREIIGWLDEWLWVFGQVGKAGVGRILEVFEYARCRYGCDVFVIDSLMRLGVGSDDYQGQEKAVFDLVSWAVEKSIHIHLVAHARKENRSAGPGQVIPDAEDVKGTSEIASNAFNIIGIWRNRKLEDEIRQANEAASRGDVTAEIKVNELAEKPTVVLNVAKQRNGDWEGKIGLWFNVETYQYRSSHDHKDGRKYLPEPMAAA